MSHPVMQTLADYTTVGVGGPAERIVIATTEESVIQAVCAADDAAEPLLVIGGGSNLIISDAGFDGTALIVANTGLASAPEGQELSEGLGAVSGCAEGSEVLVSAGAGMVWDELVAATVEAGLQGLETLSGIPGSVGATPVQNVGAYGTEVAERFASLRAWDRERGTLVTLHAGDLGFGYRDSLLKRSTVNGSPRYVVLEVSFRLTRSEKAGELKYAELARLAEAEAGSSPTLAQIRAFVLRLRGGKGMVLDPSDRDTFSTGSFFTNPIVEPAAAQALPASAPRFPSADGRVKLSAAWLIDHAGFGKGYGLPGSARAQRDLGAGVPARGDGAEIAGGRASLSTKHTLAVTNRGQATSEDLLAIARAVQDGVEQTFGIRLHNEPVLINTRL